MIDKSLKQLLTNCFTTTLYLLFGWLALCSLTYAQSPEIETTYRPQIDKVQIIWKVKFKPDNYSLDGRTEKEGIGIIPINVPKEKITLTPDDPLNPKTYTLTAELPYGADKILGDINKYVYLTVNASSGPKDSFTQNIKADLTLNLTTIKEHIELLRKITTCVVAEPATLIDKRVTKTSDRSITIQLKSSQTISVNLLAFENPDPNRLPQKGETTPFRKDNNLVLANTVTDIKIPDLRSNKKYLLVVEEIASNNPPGRTLLWEKIDGGNLIQTASSVLRPSIRVLGKPQPRKNESVYIEISAENATSVTAYVITRNKNGVPIKLSDEITIGRKPGTGNVDTTNYAGEIPVTLDEGILEYQVIARAVTNLTEDDNEAQNSSDLFKGLPRKLFDYVSYEVGDKKMNFTLQGTSNALTLKTTVTVKVNGRTLTTPCTTSAGNSCDLDVAAIFAELTNNNNNPSSTPQNNLILFEIKAETNDNSLRNQSASFAISIKGPDLSDKPASDKWKKVTDFAKSVITGKDNTKLEAKNLQGTGLGGFLGSLVRGFLSIP